MAARSPVECPICEDRYDEEARCPRNLVCGHTVCTACVHKLNHDGSNRIKCPECRAFTVLPSEGVVGLAKNYTVLHILALPDRSIDVMEAAPVSYIEFKGTYRDMH